MKQPSTRPKSVAEAALRGMHEEGVLALPVIMPLDDSNRALRIGRTVGYTLARRGEYPVPVHRLGNQYRVCRSDLLRFLGIDPIAAPEQAESA